MIWISRHHLSLFLSLSSCRHCFIAICSSVSWKQTDTKSDFHHFRGHYTEKLFSHLNFRQYPIEVLNSFEILNNLCSASTFANLPVTLAKDSISHNSNEADSDSFLLCAASQRQQLQTMSQPDSPEMFRVHMSGTKSLRKRKKRKGG